MKMYLIDPEIRSVLEVEAPADHDSIKHLIGCERTDGGRIGEFGDQLWVDDESLVRGQCFGWQLHGYSGPLAGRGIVTGVDQHGGTCQPRIRMGRLRLQIEFLGLILPKVTWSDTAKSFRAHVTYQRVT